MKPPMKQNRLFLAIDGDDVGPQLRSYVIANDLSGAASFSQQLLDRFQHLRERLESERGRIIFCGGDSILAEIDDELACRWLEEFSTVGPCTISAGIAPTAEMAYLALQLAKARGKGRLVRLSNVDAETLRVWQQ
jgi:hypothetical protein